jgi:truncated hemoglobin YjbI
MNATVASKIRALRATLSDHVLISKIVDVFYAKMLDDYRINRFFFTRPAAEQADALKAFLKAYFNTFNSADEKVLDALDGYFTTAFARTNAKPSLVTGNDFAFLLDIVGGQEIRTITLLTPAHCFLIKLGPDDFHYDIVMEHLADSLKQLNITEDLTYQILALAEKGRDGLLARGVEVKKAA